ncbi:hypothetical protein SPRG_03616 [Saprolegnia parasitica CBS 223.65]|uniref:Myb-like domain-containing protein n=1 Tax=Saprolegnia parasitica (strain CBS 223.65) TaxID=695850 RepID=A0A067CMJ9_SAPPC|nr:hypothetical protein SPRG_03616 [Saprolegnia parasitica CBS 223.65]KDO31698.1 hypothetical protein SPRG_03616 [Saprolegnia parasitica CBS 223.65]|eukprot:XP_012197584.1 hypothetical protein SPRG_03616 [Saprolegnia parasitica CBS 223.65]
MSFASVSAVYEGPHLASLDGFASWRATFLDAAGDLRLDKYYTEPDYEDAILSNLVSPAKTHLLTSRAECAEPAVPSRLSARKWEKKMQHREARVQERVALALGKEAAHLKCRAARIARLYLLSALGPPLRSEASALASPSAIWSWLNAKFCGDTMHATSTGLVRQLQCAMQIQLERDEDPVVFFERFEIAANAYVVPYLAACGGARDTTQTYADVVGDRFRVALLANALPPYLRDMFEQWQAGFAHWDYTRIKQHVMSQLETVPRSPPQEQVQEELLAKKEPSCSYCHSTRHSDATCVQRTKASPRDQLPALKRRRQTADESTRIKAEGCELANEIHGMPTPMLLADIDDFETWNVGFLDAAEELNLHEYYTTKDYEDPDLADYISPAKMHLITTNAEFAEPYLHPKETTAAYEEALHRRKSLVNDRITVAVLAECAAIKARTARRAAQHLRSALSPRLRDCLRTLHSPYDMWEALRQKSTDATRDSDLVELFDRVLSVQDDRHESAGAFCSRLEDAIDRYIMALFRPMVASAERDAVVDRLRATFLAQAVGARFQDTLRDWRRGNPSWDYGSLKQWVHTHWRLPPPLQASEDVGFLSRHPHKRSRVHDSNADDDNTSSPPAKATRRETHLSTASETSEGEREDDEDSSHNNDDDDDQDQGHLVAKHGRQWAKVLRKGVANKMLHPSRTMDGIRSKYRKMCNLDPSLKAQSSNAYYSAAEIAFLEKALVKYGNDAPRIAAKARARCVLPGRTLESIQKKIKRMLAETTPQTIKSQTII